MKRTIIFLAFIAIFTFTPAAYGQSLGFGVAPYSSSREMVTASFPMTDINRNLKIYELVKMTSSDEACYGTTDFTSARQVGPEVANLALDLTSNTYHLKWLADIPSQGDSCRILFIDGDDDVDGRDFLIWQRGSVGSYFEGGLAKDADGNPEASAGPRRVGPLTYKLVYNRAS